MNLELGQTATWLVSLNDDAVRSLAGITSGTIDLNTLHGKSRGYKIQYLVVGGGGGGGNGFCNWGGGGGGAGMVLTGTYIVRPGQSYTVTIGGGGPGGTNTRTCSTGTRGNTSTFDTIQAFGGGFGYGSHISQPAGVAQVSNLAAATGGGGRNGANQGGRGGGGATGGGGSPSTGPGLTVGGLGGSGFTATMIDGLIYGVGGAGGSVNTTANGANGTVNRGNGGAGGSSALTTSGGGGLGGSGVVILAIPTCKYPGAYTAIESTSTSSPGNILLTYTISGSYIA